MSGHQPASSDTGAAYIGLIGGALLIGAVLYGIVILTNRKFETEKKPEGKKAVVTSLVGPVSV